MRAMAKQLAKGAWVITGAASGFGREFARRLAGEGHSLALWDMNAAGLAETKALCTGVAVDCQEVDVTDPESVARAADASTTALGPLAHAVNCAGVLRVGAAENVSPADYRLMIEVNYLGTVHVSQALVPHLRAAGPGRKTLMLVASVAGLRGFPQLAGYCATKFAVVGFGQALRDELRGDDIDVKVLCPPPGDTPMVQQLETLPPVYKLSRIFTAPEVVDEALASVERPDWLVLIDVGSKALWRLGRLAPAVVDRVVRWADR